VKSNVNPPAGSPLGREPIIASHVMINANQNVSHTATPIKRKIGLKHVQAASQDTQSAPIEPLTLVAIQTTQKEIRRLESLSIKQKQDIDTLTQALSILTSTKSAELEKLAEKWRSASRLAAEEVFASARDKVNRMGGVGAWREREKERAGFAQQWDQEPMREKGDDGSDDDEEKCEEREGMEYERDERIQVVEDDWEYDRGRVGDEKEVDAGNDDDVIHLLSIPDRLC
jgi:Swi5-dependent recombination DNA repair protein 1